MTHHAPLNFEHDLPFGKYKGRGVGEVCDEDPGYIFWMINNTDCKFAEPVVEYVESECRENPA
jgi:hypothetical protein